MKIALSAHLRRSAAVLAFVDRAKADAEVIWRGHSIGTWGSILPSWVLDAEGIRLAFQTHDGRLRLQVSSARYTPRGAEIILGGRSGYSGEIISLAWEEPRSGLETTTAAKQIRNTLLPWIRRTFPDCRILHAGQRSDRANTLSGSFLRIHARGPTGDCLVLAETCSSPGSDPGAALSQALLWSRKLRARGKARRVPHLHLVARPEAADVLQHRAGLLDINKARAEVWRFEVFSGNGLGIQRAPTPSIPVENRDFRWPLLGPFRWSPNLARVLDLAPAQVRRYPRFQDYDSLRLWGLEFARATGEERDRIAFGVGSHKTEMDEKNFSNLRELVDRILYYRRPDSPDEHHPFFRLQAERWLESLILDEVPRLFPELLPESVYPQIPVYLGKDPGRVDLLGVDREGTLVVLELKVAPDPGLPLQALDYWGRVIRHNEDGDFRRRGYFSEIRLNREPPRLYLVSPLFSFHDSTEHMIRFCNPHVEIWKIAINEDWRSGVKIMRRTRLRCGVKK